MLIGSLLFSYRWHLENKRKKNRSPSHLVAFFHPYCNAGGGGERVLWCAIEALISKYQHNIRIAVYTGDVEAAPEEIIKKVQERFDVHIPVDSVEFVYLHRRKWVEAERYPYFTMLLQSIGSIWLAFESINALVPDIYIDSMGYPFTLPVFSFICQSKVGCYVHYPTITTEMIKSISFRQVIGYGNNQRFVTRNPFWVRAKLVYYKLFALLYSIAGSFSNVIMVNSSWTEEHINSLWQMPMDTYRVYPPCDTEKFQKIPLLQNNQPGSKMKIISLSQFRPEKNHPLQLSTMYYLRQIIKEDVWENVELVLIGSTRNKEDEMRVQDMRDLCRHYSLENNVTFKVNVTFKELLKELEQGLIGIHTMWNEHFGIGVVECMAAGLIVVAHGSGGPKSDIIVEAEGSRNGFLACTEAEYATAIASILSMTSEERNKIREAARSSVNRFSVNEFKTNFLRAVEPLFSAKKKI